jgi:hypothetical protein
MSAQAAEHLTTQMRAATLAAARSGVYVSDVWFGFAPLSSARQPEWGEA